ncbi:hypothetical protein BKA93DRAFT_925710 [Sparassis latifolia]
MPSRPRLTLVCLTRWRRLLILPSLLWTGYALLLPAHWVRTLPMPVPMAKWMTRDMPRQSVSLGNGDVSGIASCLRTRKIIANPCSPDCSMARRPRTWWLKVPVTREQLARQLKTCRRFYLVPLLATSDCIMFPLYLPVKNLPPYRRDLSPRFDILLSEHPALLDAEATPLAQQGRFMKGFSQCIVGHGVRGHFGTIDAIVLDDDDTPILAISRRSTNSA